MDGSFPTSNVIITLHQHPDICADLQHLRGVGRMHSGCNRHHKALTDTASRELSRLPFRASFRVSTLDVADNESTGSLIKGLWYGVWQSARGHSLVVSGQIHPVTVRWKTSVRFRRGEDTANRQVFTQPTIMTVAFPAPQPLESPLRGQVLEWV